MVLAFLLAIMLATTLGSAASGAEKNAFLPAGRDDSGWPFVRGPSWDGHSPEVNLADSWPSAGPPVLWTRELGQGYSAFVARDGRVYTQYQTLAGQYVGCLDADTGQTIWEHRYDWPYELAGVYPGPRATPTVSSGMVFFASPSGRVGCLDQTFGAPLWSRELTREYHGDGTDFGYSCSPTVVDGLVILPVGGRGASLVALDARTGATIWTSGDDPASYTPALPIRLRGRTIVVGYLQNALVACDLATGEPLWRKTLSSGYDEHSAWPLYAEPHLWISGPFRGGCELLDLAELPPKSVYRNTRLSNDILSSVLVDGAIYGFDVVDAQAKTQRPTRGHFRCLDFRTGEERWSNASLQYRVAPTDGDPPRIGHASVLAADGKLFLFNDTGELILARANPARYEELARASVLGGEIVWTPPALHRGRLYLRNHSRAVCLFVGRADLLPPETHARALNVRDVPQTPYRDWAGGLLGIEPEYAFDIPSDAWLVDWFWWSLAGVLAPAWLAGAIAGWLAAWRVRDKARRTRVRRWVRGATAFVLGAVGTSVFSRWQTDFVFTWHACLFVAYVVVVEEAAGSWQVLSPSSRSTRVRGYLVLLVFIGVCLGYFLLCRRLSLVFEWAFLAGFPAATVPLLVRRRFPALRPGGLADAITEPLAFAAFHWSAAAVLWLR